MLGTIAEVVAVVSIIGHFIQYSRHNTQEKIMLGFLHGLKPTVESASNGHAIPLDTWTRMVSQINDMLARLQRPTK